MKSSHPKSTLLVVIAMALLLVAIGVSVFVRPQPGEFPWGIHIVTIPGVCLAGVVIGWLMRDRQAAEDQARDQIKAEKKD